MSEGTREETADRESSACPRRSFLHAIAIAAPAVVGAPLTLRLPGVPSLSPTAVWEPPANANEAPQKPAEPPAAAEPPKPKPKPVPPGSPKPDLQAEIQARMDWIVARYGRFPQLDEAALNAIREDVTQMVNRSELLRSFPLDNGTGPFPIFHPYRKPENPAPTPPAS